MEAMSGMFKGSTELPGKLTVEGGEACIGFEGKEDEPVWKHPLEEFAFDEVLVVPEGREAVFFRHGKAYDIFSRGEYALKKAYLPKLDKSLFFSSGKDSTFSAELYFVNIADKTVLEWEVPETDSDMEAVPALPVRGRLVFRIKDSGLFLERIRKAKSGIKPEELAAEGSRRIRDFIRSVVRTYGRNALKEIYAKGTGEDCRADLCLKDLSGELTKKLAPVFHDFGIKAEELAVTETAFSEGGDSSCEKAEK